MSSPSPSPRVLIGLGASIVGFVVLGLVVGVLLDNWMDTSPVFTLSGLAISVLGAIGFAVVQFRKFI